MKRKIFFTNILAFVVLLAAACSPSVSNPTGNDAPGANTGQEVKVAISNFSYDPKDLEVKVGTTVIWTNLDNVEHTVTANDGSFDSGLFGKDATFSYTFQTAGSFSYYCIPHPNMVGTVTVVP